MAWPTLGSRTAKEQNRLATPADNVALPAFAAARRAAARMLLSAARAAIDRYLLPAGPTAANPPQRPNAGTDRQTDGRPTVTQISLRMRAVQTMASCCDVLAT